MFADRFFLPLLLGLIAVGKPAAAAPETTAPVAEDTIPSAEPVPQAGTPVLAADWRNGTLFSSRFGAIESSAPAPGLRLITTEQPEHIYSLQATLLNEAPVKKGDTLFLRFAARSLKSDVSSGTTKLKVGFSKSSPPWSSSYGGEIGVTSGWQRFDIPFTCKDDFGPKEARIVFQFGYPVQTAEIADVQLLRYDSSVAPGSLPKTARRADPVSPEVLAAEVARIAKMRAELGAFAHPVPASGRTLHVSPAGTAGAEFTSLPAAVAAARPGDTVLVEAGEYRVPRGVQVQVSGRPDAWIKIKAAPGARPKIISSGWEGFGLSFGIGYIEIEGFELSWIFDPAVMGDTGERIHGAGVAVQYATHHIRVLNNVVHGFGTGGIISLDCDYLFIEGNTIYDCAKTSPYGGSAISLCRAFDFDREPSYHNVIRGNVAYDNELKVIVAVTSGGNGRTLTDGNGIIIDSFDRSRKNPLKRHNLDRDGPLAPYHGATLVENNLMYDNGGRGIHNFRSSNVDVINNTCYMNQKTADINGGEYTGIEGDRLTFFNNIAYGRKDKRGNAQDGGTRVIWSHNLFYNVGDVLLHDGLIQTDPQFIAPALTAKPDGFRLQPGSPALGQGLTAVAPTTDLTGKPRPGNGPTDLGAFQSSQ